MGIDEVYCWTILAMGIDEVTIYCWYDMGFDELAADKSMLLSNISADDG